MVKIPDGWKVGKLVDNLESLIDYRGKTPKSSDSGIVTLSAKSVKMGFIDYSQAYHISKETYDQFMTRGFPKKGDILMTTEAPLGCIAKLNRDDVAVAQRLLTLRGKDKILDNNYLMYYLMSSKGQHELLSRMSGSTVEGISRKQFENVEILLPPLPEQQAIASVLSSFDDKIELLREENQTLEEMGQTLFKERFGKYKVGDDLPEGWRWGKLGEIINEVISGNYGQETKDEVFCIETKCLRGCDLPDMKKGLPKNAPIRYLKEQKINDCKLINGDIVIEISGGTENQSTGRTMYINNEILNAEQLPITCVNFCKIIRPKKLIYSYFMYLYLNILYQKGVFFNIENGTTGIKNLDMKALMNLEIIIPNEDSCQKFNDFVQKLYIKIQKNNIQIESLSITRDQLLPKLMSGEVRVKF